MKVLLMTIGSRGDIEPFIALGVGLKNKGHQVSLCAPVNFQSMIEAHSFKYCFLTDELFEIVEKGTLEAMGSLISGIRTAVKMHRLAKPINRKMLRQSIEAGLETRPELIIYHPKAMAAASIAEKLRIPAVMAVLQPMVVPTQAFPPAGLPNLGKYFNRLNYRLIEKGFGQYRQELNQYRETLLALPPLRKGVSVLTRERGQSIPVLHAYSDLLIPRPNDWPETARVCGDWFLRGEQTDYQPPAELKAFLEHPQAPIYIGFGSMSGRDPKQTTRIVLQAVKASGVRAIIASGWGGLELADHDDKVLMIKGAPHYWLFHKVAAVIHHGGAGTTAAGLRAGKPTLICPFFGDQPFWGQTVVKHGLGPKPIKQKNLTVDNLAHAISEMVTDQEMQTKAKQLGIQLMQQDGIDTAITWLEQQNLLSN
ncbi:glycosyltransferase [Vibrio sp. WXL210]|uniref:glycosyltransferase n=1 Tax=Vibrio sp. WXL210 TaxID=3450709 RepID=UPI003EC5EBE1